MCVTSAQVEDLIRPPQRAAPTKNGAILQPAGAIQPIWTSERDNGRVVLRSTRDMGWLITVAPNSNALLMTPAGRVGGTGNCR